MARELFDSIKALIDDEYARRGPEFVEGVDIDQYIAKLAEKAEFLTDSISGRCRGFVGYYCNDLGTKTAYITLVLVDPRDRGLGIGRALVGCVLDLAKRRGFVACRLEVTRRNEVAHAMYRSMGFRVVEERGDRDLLEIGL